MYAKHGFKPDGEEFVEDGIPHVPMRRGGVAVDGVAYEAAEAAPSSAGQ